MRFTLQGIIMFRKLTGLLLSLVFLGGVSLFAQEGLKKDILDLVDETVFEVIVLKPTNDSLKYEKPLPMDLLPFTVRNDKYYSIGTAFAISSNRLMSAAHVFNMEYDSIFKDLFCRDKKGNIYKVDTVYGFSDNRDFVIFSIQGRTFKKILKQNLSPVINEKVFAVGNALGEGIIVRDGVFTSKTPEEENGEWEWYRFSAAASPGNSGGPLLDKDGNIIGLITAKSENENLNYALPLSVINAFPPKTAACHQKYTYTIANMKKDKLQIRDYKTTLPKSYKDLKFELFRDNHVFGSNLLNALADEYKDVIFPMGKGSISLLHDDLSDVFPNMICEKDDGNWGAFYPSEKQDAKLDKNGKISYGDVNGVTMGYFERPDNVSQADFLNDSKLFMDLFLKAIPLNRTIVSKATRIVSMGAAKERFIHTDRWGRKWIVQTWPMEYNDSKLLIFSLPTPGGVMMMAQLGQTGLVDSGMMLDLKFLTDFVYYAYYGTFKQWTEFFNLKDFLPGLLTKVSLSYDKGTVTFRSPSISLTYGKDLMDISEDSDMKLKIGFFPAADGAVWDIKGVQMGENMNNPNFFSVNKNQKPVDGLDRSYFDDWDKIVKQKYPYNNESYVYEGNTYIAKLPGRYDALKKTAPAKVPVDFIYTLSLGFEGKMKNDAMVKKLKLAEAGTTLND